MRQIVHAFFSRGRKRDRRANWRGRRQACDLNREWNSRRLARRFGYGRICLYRLRRFACASGARHRLPRRQRQFDALEHPQPEAKTNEEETADHGNNAGRQQAAVKCVVVDRQTGCGKDHAGHTQHRTESQQKQVHSLCRLRPDMHKPPFAMIVATHPQWRKDSQGLLS
ncbi:MAG: hypothetical protein WBQ24_11020 [Xanthobacteraceae bacterium]